MILELLAPAALLHSPLHKDKMNTVQLPGEREIPGGGREFTCRKRRYWLAVINYELVAALVYRGGSVNEV